MRMVMVLATALTIEPESIPIGEHGHVSGGKEVSKIQQRWPKSQIGVPGALPEVPGAAAAAAAEAAPAAPAAQLRLQVQVAGRDLVIVPRQVVT